MASLSEAKRIVVKIGSALLVDGGALRASWLTSLAEDVAQETLVKAWLALPTFRAESSLRSWVLRIAHNTAVSTLRTRRAVVVDPHELPEREGRPEPSVESKVQSQAVVGDFVDALDLLDDLSRSIVVLRELEGMAYEEISEALKISLGTVKSRLSRAHEALDRELTPLLDKHYLG